MSKQEFLSKYHNELCGRILAGLAADHKNATLGQYAKHVMEGSAALLMQMYDDLVSQPPAEKKK